jgi:hypothetical protein
MRNSPLRPVATLLALVPVLACGQPAPAAPAAPPPPAAAAPAAPAPAPAAEAPADFSKEAKAIFALIACGGDALPAEYDAKTVEAYCGRQKRALAAARRQADEAGPFIAKLRPEGLPTTVFYPFGGGDLLTALTVYPDGTDFTTLSLEHAGDPRRLPLLAKKGVLADSLELVRATTNGLLHANDSMTENMMKGQRGELPGQLAFFLLGLAVHGYEPVSLRYFWINDDGTIHYVTLADVAAVEKENAALLRGRWTAPDFSRAFSNSELTFAKKGGDPKDVRVHRHVAWDLSDPAMKKNPGLLRWLEAKGPVSAMTKAASYCLWNSIFSTIRDYTVKHMVFMVADSTGIPPKPAKAAGFTMETYGKFAGSFLEASASINDDFRALFAQFPKNRLKFRFGYIDSEKNYHMVVYRKGATPKP